MGVRALIVEMVANPLDLVEESIHLKDSFHQLLVDLVLVVKDLVDTKEAQEDLIVEEVYQGTVLVKLDLEAKTLDNMEDLGHMDQEAFLDLMVTALVVDHHLQEVAIHLALDHHMDLMEGLQEIKEAQVLAMVVNLPDSEVDPILLKGSFPQPLVDLVAKDLLEA